MDDRKTGSLIMYYGLLMLTIAGLGLVGLVALFAEQRTKEIGIRRVLGASPASVFGLLSKELLILVGLASFLAWPIGYVIASGWIQKYACRIELSSLIFVAASSFVLVLLSSRWPFNRCELSGSIQSTALGMSKNGSFLNPFG